jgi:hypothetical protein
LVTEHEWRFGQAATSPVAIGAGEVEESIKKQISRLAVGSLEMTVHNVFKRNRVPGGVSYWLIGRFFWRQVPQRAA